MDTNSDFIVTEDNLKSENKETITLDAPKISFPCSLREFMEANCLFSLSCASSNIVIKSKLIVFLAIPAKSFLRVKDMPSDNKENQTKSDDKKQTAVAVVSGVKANDTPTQKDTTPPQIVKTDNLLNFALSEAKKKEEKKREQAD
jgi:hypothetical protein